jgi:purine-binding chemotaxis protein CheW
MTMQHTFLVVGYRKARYALDARAVQEVVWLPELSPIEEMPPYIRGVFNLRGEVMPVLDLGLRFGYECQQAAPQDRVVIITEGSHRIGIVVHELHDVAAVSDDAVEAVGKFQLPGGQTRYLRGAVMQDEGPLMLLDCAALLHEAVVLEPIAAPAAEERSVGDAEEDVFRARARELSRELQQQDNAARGSYALIRLGGELFGLDVGVVREFVHLRGLTPVPCAPAHVAGNVSLRGEILTVVDIRSMLGVPQSIPAEEVAVLFAADMQFGLLAEAIEDVVSISTSDISLAPSGGSSGGADICPGVASIDQGFASLIDPERMITALQLPEHTTAEEQGHQP